MIVLEIDSVKEFMQHMFQGSMFDRFPLRSCEVTTFATFHIDGRCFEDWFDSDEKRTDETGLVTWNKLQFVTGYMQKEFSLDKKGQQAWDDNCLQFIKKHEIVSTQLE